jgi:phosphate transport system substrate-binding protein
MTKKRRSPPPIILILIGIALIAGGAKLLPFIKDSLFAQGGKSIASGDSLIASVQGVPSGEVRIGGSTSAAGMRAVLEPIIELAYPKFHLKYLNPENGIASTETGLEMLLEGKLDVIYASSAIPEEILQKAKQKGIKLKTIPVAISGVAVAVHPSLNIPGMTINEYHKILQGTIKNWRDVRGPDLKIRIYNKDGNSLDGAPFIPIKTATEAFKRIANDPGGFHVASASLVVPQCGVKALPVGLDASHFIVPYKSPLIPVSECSSQNHNLVDTEAFSNGNYPLLKTISIVMIEDAGFREKAGTVYSQMILTAQGQDLVRQAGYLTPR